jgi:hypothetical protein
VIGEGEGLIYPFSIVVIPALGEAALRLPPAGTKFRREAKAGIHRADDAAVEAWTPAFAGVTRKEGP